MEALSASESHSQTFLEKRIFFFVLAQEIDLISGPNFLRLLYSENLENCDQYNLCLYVY